MSHLLQRIVWEPSYETLPELQPIQRGDEEPWAPSTKSHDDDWDHLWTDLGGEC